MSSSFMYETKSVLYTDIRFRYQNVSIEHLKNFEAA